ncbi:CapA family protein [Actinoalloteichus caeruleus]|uniref:CapA family protein n=1 Tax=Actinoalloteichus cyanogriseus TaxID=2893586 RepID=UPI0004ABC0F1|nr:CapA family protein [Actinoalloteichus caeruleus]
MRYRVPTLALALSLLAAGCTGGSPVVARPPELDAAGAGAAQAPDDTFVLVATGDVLVHPALTEQAELDAAETGEGERDFRPLFAGVAPLVEDADVALCHLEVPIAPAEGPFLGWPRFSAPPEVVTGLAATGYDVCTTASNHTVDQGEEGVIRTLEALDDVGLGQAGAARTEEEALTPLVREVNGARVAHISHTFSFNGVPLPEGKPWMSNTLDPEEILAGARRAREAGAEVVVASLHWGVEYVHEPTQEQQDLAELLLADDAIDLIIGHHAHSVQPFERINGKWVTYGLGNHVARHAEPRGITEEGVAARFTFERDEAGDWAVTVAEYVPTLVELGPPIRLVDLTTADIEAPGRAEALARTEEVVLSRGGAEHGLTRYAG